MNTSLKEKASLLLLCFSVLVLFWSGLDPKDRFTWYLEVAPGVIGLALLGLFWRRYAFTPLLLALIALHSIVLYVGGKYTYAEVPLGEWAKQAFWFSRNHYDRIGHFMQGFEPAILAREILLRNQVVQKGKWLTLFVISSCLAFSAIYELIEWLVAVLTGQGAEAFLGTQGDPWDTQTDMAMAFLGASCALIFLSRIHQRQLDSVKWNKK